jgi:hypothetical protein
MRLYILLLSFLVAASGVVCQQAGNLNEMSALISVLGEKPEYTALVDAMGEIDTLQESGAPKKKITAALNALIKQVAFIKNYSSDADLDLILAWCAAHKGKSIAPSKNLSSSAAAYNGRSADDLALALSERPEYAELFELFVTVQVMIAQQSPLKKIRPHVFKLIERIQFVQKYASDEVLDEVMSWCYAQKGCSKRAMAGWKKALIGMAAAVFVLGLGVGVRKVRARRHGHGAHGGHGGVHHVALAGGPGHHGALGGLAPHGGLGELHNAALAALLAVHAAGGGGVALGPVVVGDVHNDLHLLNECTFTHQLGGLDKTGCPVCLEDFQRGDECCMDIAKTHAIHQQCLQNCFNTSGVVRCPVCRVLGYSHYLRFNYPATAPAGATAGAGSGAGGVGAGSGGVSAGAGAGPAELAIVSGVKQLRVSPALPIGVAQAVRLLPLGFIPANTLVRFGTTVAYILSGQQYQALPCGVVVGPIDEYKVSNNRVAAPRGYTKVASFTAANDDEIFIYRQNAPTS